MTAQRTSQSTTASDAPVAKEAALIANFYGKRDQLQPLVDHLVQSLALTPYGYDSYANEVTKALLHHFDPPAAPDTSIIQMALNTAEAVGTAWTAMRKQLEAILSNDEILKNVWGYTLIYQAELVQDVPFNVALDKLLPAARQLYPELSERPQILARSKMAGGSG